MLNWGNQRKAGRRCSFAVSPYPDMDTRPLDDRSSDSKLSGRLWRRARGTRRALFFRNSRPLLVPVLFIVTGVTILVLALRALGIFVLPELAIYDRLLSARSRVAAAPAGVVLVGFNEEDLRRWGWPLTDELLARILEAIVAQRPRAIGLDIYRDVPVPPGTDILAEVLAQNAQVIGVMKVGDNASNSVPAHKVLAQDQRAGFTDVVVDPGGVVRRGLLYMDQPGRTYQAFPLLLALKYLEAEGIRPNLGDAETGAMQLGAAMIPPLEENAGGYVRADAAGYQFMLDYIQGPMPFQLVTATELLENKVETGTFRDKVVIIGSTAESLKDFFYSPFDEQHVGKHMLHGFAIHGHVVAQVLRMARGVTPVPKVSSETMEVSTVAFAALIGVICALFFRSPALLAAMGILGLAALAAITWTAFARYVWFPVVPQSAAWAGAIVATLAFLSWREHAERSVLMSLFSRHLSPEIANEIWSRRTELVDPAGQPRCQRVTATILFSDIKGFTTIAEQLGPREQMDWLNRYMSAMVGVVQSHAGTVNQLIGDCVMAVFGVPISRNTEEEIRQDAVNAVDCALAMRAALDPVNDENRRLRLPQIAIRIGIYTGPVVTGAVGAKDRAQFAIVGDTVNTAARLESLKLEENAPVAGDERCRILIGEDTLRLLDGRYATVPIGVKALKGKNQPLAVFMVQGLAQAARI